MMLKAVFPVIDPAATGRNILNLRKEKGLSVKQMQEWFGFEEPRAIYKWQAGQCLPSVDNLYALSRLLEVPMDRIIVETKTVRYSTAPQADACGAAFLFILPFCGCQNPAQQSI